MWGGGRPHVERPTGTAGEEGTAGMAEVSGLHVERPAEEEVQIERWVAREAVKEAMRKEGKRERGDRAGGESEEVKRGKRAWRESEERKRRR